jgi:hypothetical protein
MKNLNRVSNSMNKWSSQTSAIMEAGTLFGFENVNVDGFVKSPSAALRLILRH